MADDRDVVLGGHPDDRGTTRQRRGAMLYDAIVVTWALSLVIGPLVEVAPVLARAALLWLWLLLVLVEGTTGASPGKHVTGTVVRRVDGGRMGLVAAALRRPWGWLLPLQLVVPDARNLLFVVAVATAVTMLVTIERSPDRRGFHDRIGGTVVEAGEFSARARLTVVLLTLAVAVTGLVLATRLAPAAIA